MQPSASSIAPSSRRIASYTMYILNEVTPWRAMSGTSAARAPFHSEMAMWKP